MAMRGVGDEGAVVRYALYAGEPTCNQLVGAVLNPGGARCVGRAAVGWVVLEAAVLRRVVRGRDHDAVGQVVHAVLVVGEDGVRERGRRRVGQRGIDAGLDFVAGQHFERGVECRVGQRVRILCDEDGAGDAVDGAVLDDGLRDGGDVVVVEAGEERTAAVAGGSERDLLRGDSDVRMQRVVGGDEARNVDERVWRGELAGGVWHLEGTSNGFCATEGV